MIRLKQLTCTLLLLWAFTPLAAEAQSFQLAVTFPAAGCVWAGTVFVTNAEVQSGCVVNFEGTSQLTRIEGSPDMCSATLTGTAAGTISSGDLTFGIATSEAGTVDFTGALSQNGQFASGTWSGVPGSGTWIVSAEVDLGSATATMSATDSSNGCEWRGPIDVAGGLTFTGSVILTRVSGDPSTCPPTLTGPLSGVFLEPAVCFQVDSPELAALEFTGNVNTAAQTASGAWSDDTRSGTWSVQLSFAIQPAPGLGAIGMGILVVALVGAGMRSVRRRRI